MSDSSALAIDLTGDPTLVAIGRLSLPSACRRVAAALPHAAWRVPR